MSESSMYIPHTTVLISDIDDDHHHDDNENENETSACSDDDRCRRLEQENQVLKRQLNATQLTVEELEDKNRFEATKVMELQDILNHNNNNNNNNVDDHDDTMELLVKKSLRLAELSLLVDDLRMENKQVHLENSKLRKELQMANDNNIVIRSDPSWDTVTSTTTTSTSATIESSTLQDEERDDPEEEEKDPDDVLSIASFSTTGSLDRPSNHTHNNNDIGGDDHNDDVDETNWQTERQRLMEKLQSLEQSLAALKQQSKKRTIKSNLNLRTMQRQLSKLETDKRTLSNQNRLLQVQAATAAKQLKRAGVDASRNSADASGGSGSGILIYESDSFRLPMEEEEIRNGYRKPSSKTSSNHNNHRHNSPSSSSSPSSSYMSHLSPNSRFGRVMGGMRNNIPPILFGRKGVVAAAPSNLY